MKAVFYPKLAADGIRKNKRLYFPYILSGIVMVMMFYILSYLVVSPALSQIPGGSTLVIILPMGAGVIGFFSLIFLFYTNSFLIRQRYREFGLYNILGMDKRNIGKIMIWESLIVGASAIVSGIVIGIVFSKLAELVLLNLLKLDVSYQLSIAAGALGKTVLVYGVIYLLLLFNSLIKIGHSRPLELIKSNKVGEKPPKGNWFFALLGIVVLGAAYYLAVSIKEPLTAISLFFAAVLLVIVATYMFFISGSVLFCRILQKNKKYYYKPNHFVSVSSMVYRMKRNGAGLASICILLTMVLVMISSTSSLYFGVGDSIRSRYPSGVNVTVTLDSADSLNDENIEALRSIVLEQCGEDTKLKDWRVGEIPGLFTEEGITIDYSSHVNFSFATYDNVGYLSVISLDDYNRMTGKSETLAADECMLYCIRTEYTSDTFTMEGSNPYKVKKVLDEFIDNGEYNSLLVPTICLITDDFNGFVEPVLSMKNENGDPMMIFDWQCGFDLDTAESEIEAAAYIRETLRSIDMDGKNGVYSYSVESREANRDGFFQLYGGLFFLGIILSVVFLLAAVMLIYYKQISEGYEDQDRFEIMQKVGMTKRDIRQSVNSQMLTVFFLPLVFAGIHLAFAFPLIWKILMIFNLNNLNFIIMVTLICYTVFGLFYAIVYKITSNSYYSIVSGKKE